jgi:hypothetical protein
VPVKLKDHTILLPVPVEVVEPILKPDPYIPPTNQISYETGLVAAVPAIVRVLPDVMKSVVAPVSVVIEVMPLVDAIIP